MTWLGSSGWFEAYLTSRSSCSCRAYFAVPAAVQPRNKKGAAIFRCRPAVPPAGLQRDTFAPASPEAEASPFTFVPLRSTVALPFAFDCPLADAPLLLAEPLPERSASRFTLEEDSFFGCLS